MFKRILRKVRKKLDAKRTFRIHFIAFNDFKLDDHLMFVNECYPLKKVHELAAHEKIVDVRMRPSQLRRTLSIFPHDEVTASYEEI